MGIAIGGQVIASGGNLVVGGIAPAGIAVKGQVVFASAVPPPPAALSIITSVVFGTTRNNFDGWVGTYLLIGERTLIVSAIGTWVLEGNTQPIEMLITDRYGNFGASAVLDIASAPPNRFAYVDLSQPFTMRSHGEYCAFLRVFQGGDYWGVDDAVLTIGPDANISSVYAMPGFPERPGIVQPSASYGPVDCLYEIGWELIAHTGASDGSDMTTPAIDTTGADLLVIVGATYQAPMQVPTDSKGNSWVLGVSARTGQAGVDLHYCRGGVVGPGHTFRWTGDYGAICVLAFSGSAADPADQSSGATIINSGTIYPGPITPSVDNALIVSGISHNDMVWSIGGGFDITDLFPAGAQMAGGAAYLLQTTAAAINPAWTITGSPYPAAAVQMSFKRA